MTDGFYNHKYNCKWPTPHFHGAGNNLGSIRCYDHFTPYDNDSYLCPSIYSVPVSVSALGALHVLSCLSCTTLQDESYDFHFAQEKSKA